MSRRVVLVGNAPLAQDITCSVDAADWVVRFNNASGFGQHTGTKVDDLFLVNCGGQPLEWLRSDTFWHRDVLAKTSRVTLPWAASEQSRILPSLSDGLADDIEGLNFEWDMRDALRPSGRSVQTLPRAVVYAAIETLRALGAHRSAAPSTGFLAAYAYAMQDVSDASIDLFGFSFVGWSGHPWDQEKAWVLDQQDRGRLRWHAP